MTHVEGVIRKARAALAGYMMLFGVISANEIRTLQWDVLTKLPQPLSPVEVKLLLEALVEWLNDELISAADFDATKAAFLGALARGFLSNSPPARLALALARAQLEIAARLACRAHLHRRYPLESRCPLRTRRPSTRARCRRERRSRPSPLTRRRGS
mmetsp:Transcript_20660/g.52427  ORF Transcript_20660/g.52427 Transcript_20660/m.52427 type:complete len:157 (-) Transcript_20660:1266-1736(-)